MDRDSIDDDEEEEEEEDDVADNENSPLSMSSNFMRMVSDFLLMPIPPFPPTPPPPPILLRINLINGF